MLFSSAHAIARANGRARVLSTTRVALDERRRVRAEGPTPAGPSAVPLDEKFRARHSGLIFFESFNERSIIRRALCALLIFANCSESSADIRAQ